MSRTIGAGPAATLALAAVFWVAAVERIDGMDMSVATELESFPLRDGVGLDDGADEPRRRRS